MITSAKHAMVQFEKFHHWLAPLPFPEINSTAGQSSLCFVIKLLKKKKTELYNGSQTGSSRDVCRCFDKVA